MLRDTSSFTQSVAGWAAGSYTISFRAAQRGNQSGCVEDFQVLVDGHVVGTFAPAGTAYRAYSTATFAVAAGAHTITFVGLDTANGDNTALIDEVALAIAPPHLNDRRRKMPNDQHYYYVEIEKIINNAVKCWTFGPTFEASLAAAEVELGVRFPADYRAFLSAFGAAQVFDLDIFGIPDTRDTDFDNPPMFHNVIDQTLSLRDPRSAHILVPENLIHIGLDSSGGGFSFFIETRENAHHGAVLLLQAGSSTLTFVANGFYEFLKQLSNTDLYEILRSSNIKYVKFD